MFICASGDTHGAMDRLYQDVFKFAPSRRCGRHWRSKAARRSLFYSHRRCCWPLELALELAKIRLGW